jgi:uncharacterized protein with ParB-like and HNH nuclease domain
MSIDTKQQNFSQLVSTSSNISYKVPNFQRDFVWKTTGEIQEFWQDIEEEFTEIQSSNLIENYGMFLGNLILCNPENEKNTFQIIDGQQRITTIFILLIAFRSNLKRLLLIDKTKESEINRIISSINSMLLFHDRDTGETLGTRFTAASSVKTMINYLANPSWQDDFPDKIEKKHIKRQRNRVKPIYDYFQEKIHDAVNIENYSAFFKTINTLTFVRITLTDFQEAYIFFERTNSRGKNLEVGDLLKAHLFANHKDEKEIVEIWDQIVSKSNNLLTRMLKYFYITEKGHITTSKLFNGLKNLYKEENKELSTLKLVLELERFADFFDAVNKINEDKELLPIFKSLSKAKKPLDADRLHKIYCAIDGLNLFGVTQTTPLMWSVLNKYYELGLNDDPQHKKEDTLVRFFESLENYHFVNNFILDRVGNEVEKLYAAYACDFSRVDTAFQFKNTLKEFFSTLNDQLAPQKTFVAEFADLAYSETRNNINLYYIFDRFENIDKQFDKLPKPNRNRIFNQYKTVKNTGIDIEHWFPRSKAKDEDDEVLLWCNNIGNLMALSAKANKKLSSKMPQEKYEFMMKNTEYNSYNHVNRFLEDYGSSFDNWNEEKIYERAKKLADEAYTKIWKFNPPFLD